MSISAQVLRLAARSVGVASDEVPGCTPRQVTTATVKLAARGELVKTVADGRGRWRTPDTMVRYFTTAAARDAYLAVQAAAPRPAPPPAPGDQRRAAWAPDAPAVVPEHVQVQRCPGFVPRFQEHTFAFVHSGLRSA